MTEREHREMWRKEREWIVKIVEDIDSKVDRVWERLTSGFEKEIREREEGERAKRARRRESLRDVIDAQLKKAANPDTYKFVPFTSSPEVRCKGLRCLGRSIATWVLKERDFDVLMCDVCREAYPQEEVERYVAYAEQGEWQMFPRPRKKARKECLSGGH